MQPIFIYTKKGTWLFIGIIWLFQISGIIGVTIGFQDWFIPKTPLLLSLNLGILILLFPILDGKTALAGIIVFVSGMVVEWIGVHHDFLFGAYHYGTNLGPKIQGVPWLIGANWLVLVFTTAYLAKKWVENKWLSIILGALLMVFLDFFIEKSAPPFDFWIWENGNAPIRNYSSWFGIALVLHFVVQKLLKIESRSEVNAHIYYSQLVFFIYFYFVHSA